jgi:uncharacterized membrane protein (UPF0127 family)
MRRHLLRLCTVAVVAAAGCTAGGATPPAPVTETTASITGAESTVPVLVPDLLAGLDQEVVGLGGADLLVAVADDPETRAQGLMGVTDLGDLDGMLFVLDAAAVTRFWMKDTLIPLDIAFFDDERAFVASFSMEPCTADPCPSYGPDVPVRYAVEVPAGDLPVLAPGTMLARGG